MRKLAKTLDVRWSDEQDVVTLGGLLAETLDRIPEQGDSIDWHGYRILVLSASETRAEMVQISPLPAKEDTTTES
jgi:CBS domain containing-hemolysin-like protein